MPNIFLRGVVCVVAIAFSTSCGQSKITKNPNAFGGSAITNGYKVDTLPQPYATPSAKNFSKVVGWEEGETPVAPSGRPVPNNPPRGLIDISFWDTNFPPSPFLQKPKSSYAITSIIVNAS